jgi:D-glycero-D-manno-heptose 1,7-bisphosphate phosphatase
MGRPAAFLDRDGTIIREVDYLGSPTQVRLLPRAGEALRLLNEAGLAVVVTTNQSGIARGMLTEDDLERIHLVLEERLAHRGARLDGIYYCPHHPDVGEKLHRIRCRCRKPSPGMLERAARELDLELSQSYAVGDGARDVEAGRRAGCRTVLVRTGHGDAVDAVSLGPDLVAKNLFEAVKWILRDRDRGGRR